MSNHTFIRRDSWKLRVPAIKREDDNVNLTGASMWFTVKKRFADADPGEIQVTDGGSASGNIEITIVGSTALITVNPVATNIQARDYFYDIQLKEADGTTSTIESGKLTVSEDATITG